MNIMPHQTEADERGEQDTDGDKHQTTNHPGQDLSREHGEYQTMSLRRCQGSRRGSIVSGHQARTINRCDQPLTTPKWIIDKPSLTGDNEMPCRAVSFGRGRQLRPGQRIKSSAS
jgi:hypothetical protein